MLMVFQKKKLSDIRSEIHLVRSSIVSSGQFARALKKYILRLDLGIWRALEGNTDTRALKALGDSRHWDTRHLDTSALYLADSFMLDHLNFDDKQRFQFVLYLTF